MTSLRRTLLVSGCLFLWFTAFNLRAADEASGKSKPSSPASLDEQLLEGLDNALLEGLNDEPTKKPDATVTSELQTKTNPRRSANTSNLDDDLLRELGGEDVAEPAAAQDPLVEIGRQMRSVESRLAEQKLDRQTKQLQQKILYDLTALLQECKKQCQGGGSGKPGSKPGKSGKGSQAGKSPADQAPSDTARDSSENLRDRKTQRGDKGALANAMKESWGSLPEHARQHLRNVDTDAFLPKYELMLEKYFKRLGEEDANAR